MIKLYTAYRGRLDELPYAPGRGSTDIVRGATGGSDVQPPSQQQGEQQRGQTSRSHIPAYIRVAQDARVNNNIGNTRQNRSGSVTTTAGSDTEGEREGGSWSEVVSRHSQRYRDNSGHAIPSDYEQSNQQPRQPIRNHPCRVAAAPAAGRSAGPSAGTSTKVV